MAAPTFRVVVVGAGAVGAWTGTRVVIGDDSAHVTLVGRHSLLSAARETGQIRSALLGEAPQVLPLGERLQVTDTAQDAVAEADVIIVAVKSVDTRAVAESLARAVRGTPRKTIVSMQNGIGNATVLAESLPEHCIVPCVVELNVVWGPGATFAQKSSGSIFLGPGDPSVARLAEALNKGGVPCSVEDDVEALMHGKLVVNMINAVNALGGLPVLATFRDAALRRAIRASMLEAIEVLKATGRPIRSTKGPVWFYPLLLGLPAWLFNIVQPLIVKLDGEAKTSMLQDLEKHKPTEVEFLNGAVVRLAAESGLAEPVINAKICKLVAEAEASGEGSPMLTGAALSRLLDL